jgi:hypothetical protein
LRLNNKTPKTPNKGNLKAQVQKLELKSKIQVSPNKELKKYQSKKSMIKAKELEKVLTPITLP